MHTIASCPHRSDAVASKISPALLLGVRTVDGPIYMDQAGTKLVDDPQSADINEDTIAGRARQNCVDTPVESVLPKLVEPVVGGTNEDGHPQTTPATVKQRVNDSVLPSSYLYSTRYPLGIVLPYTPVERAGSYYRYIPISIEKKDPLESWKGSPLMPQDPADGIQCSAPKLNSTYLRSACALRRLRHLHVPEGLSHSAPPPPPNQRFPLHCLDGVVGVGSATAPILSPASVDGMLAQTLPPTGSINLTNALNNFIETPRPPGRQRTVRPRTLHQHGQYSGQTPRRFWGFNLNPDSTDALQGVAE
ncbi:hypothetical protein C8F04DRAFT_1198489 [Mycena alexandri]|uniref:Uncharacterized protein n=1 Tax=Mycena alexandri TaxID=1745969 RepID=A0AAD6S0Z1_9AGAR|nr:hypothetical protein C8F04DRAFT_1198489 [Mycena alexandri]